MLAMAPIPTEPNNFAGNVTDAAPEYVEPIRRIAVRSMKSNGKWATAVLLTSLSEHEVSHLVGFDPPELLSESEIVAAFVYFYDLRGGGVETTFKSDKQALGMSKRNKQSFVAQQMLTQLGALTHNLLVWFRSWIAERSPRLMEFGLLRLIRDLLTIDAHVQFDRNQAFLQITLNHLDPFSRRLVNSVHPFLARSHIDIILGET